MQAQVSPDDDGNEIDKHLEARDCRYSCLIFKVQYVCFDKYIFSFCYQLIPNIGKPVLSSIRNTSTSEQSSLDHAFLEL